MTSNFPQNTLKALLLLFLMPTLLFAGAWTQKKGSYYLEVSSSYSQSGSEFDFRGDKQDILADFSFYQNTSYRELRFDAYGEYSLNDRFTLVGYVPLKHAIDKRRIVGVGYLDNTDRTTTTTGLGDARLGARIRLWQNAVAVSVESAFKLPLGYDTSNQNEGPALGTGEIDWQNMLWLGSSFANVPIYTTGHIGFRKRNGVFNDEIIYHFEVGYTPGPLSFKLALNGVQNTGELRDIYGEEVITPLPGGGGELPVRIFGDQDFTKFNFDINWQATPSLALKLKTFNTPIGKNVVAESIVALAVVITPN